jgi:hypothetical protein
MVDALKVLVADGSAKAYDLSGAHDPFGGEIPAMPPLDAVEEYSRTYFLIANPHGQLPTTPLFARLHDECSPNTCSDLGPISLAQVPDHRQLRTVSCQNVGPEI